MELAILITVNLIISFLVYVAFSVRFRMALDKERKNRVPRAFYDNLQMTIQYINTATSAVDEKTQNFYRQLRKSEEILKRLEKANEDFEKNLKKSRRKTKNGPNPDLVIPESTEADRARSRTTGRNSADGNRADWASEVRASGQRSFSNAYSQISDSNPDGAQENGSDQGSLEELGEEGRHMQRLLDRMQGDVIQVSSSEDDDSQFPAQGSYFAATGQARPAKESAGSGILARIGGAVGRVLGINSGAFSFSRDAEEPSNASARKTSAFDREVDRMSRAPGFQESGSEGRDTGGVQSAEADSFLSSSSYRERRKDYYVSGMDPEGDLRNSFRDNHGERNDASEDENSFEKAVSSDFHGSAADAYPTERSDGRVDSRVRSASSDGAGEVSTEQPASTEQERRITRVQEFLESTGINLLDTTPQTRAVLIRELGTLGFDPPDIIRATRFPPSEVALVLQLPTEPGDNRRRTRKIRS